MPICKNCGNEMPAGVGICPTCGAPQPAEGAPLSAYGSAPPDSAFAPEPTPTPQPEKPAAPAYSGTPLSSYGSAPPDSAFAPEPTTTDQLPVLPSANYPVSAYSAALDQPAAHPIPQEPVTQRHTAPPPQQNNAPTEVLSSPAATPATTPGQPAPTAVLSPLAAGQPPASTIPSPSAAAPAAPRRPQTPSQALPDGAGASYSGPISTFSFSGPLKDSDTSPSPAPVAPPPPSTPGQPGAPLAWSGQPAPHTGDLWNPATPYQPASVPTATGTDAIPWDARPKRKTSKLLPLIIVVAVLFVILGVLLYLLFTGALDNTGGVIAGIQKNNDFYAATYYQEDPDTGYTLRAMEDGTTFYVGADVDTFYSSVDKYFVVHTVEITGAGGTRQYELFVSDVTVAEQAEPKPIATKVTDYRLSPYNKAVYYLTEDGSFYRYKNATEEKLASDVQSFAFSTNDKYVLYVSSGTLYSLAIGKEPVRQSACSDTATVLGISKDGALMFYAEADAAGEKVSIICHHQNGADESVMAQIPTFSLGNVFVHFNYDCDEAVITGGNGIWRYTDLEGFVLYAQEEATAYYDGDGALFSFYYYGYDSARVSTDVRLVTDFDSFFYTTAAENSDTAGDLVETLYYVHRDAQPLAIDSGITGGAYQTTITVNRDGSLVTYLKDDELYQAAIYSGAVESTAKIASNLLAYRASVDGETVYYGEKSSQEATTDTFTYSLFHLFVYTRASGQSVEIADGVDRFTTSPNGQWCGYVVDYDNIASAGASFLFDLATNTATEVSTATASLLRVGNNGSLVYLDNAQPLYPDDEYSVWSIGELYWFSGGTSELLDENAIY